MGKKKKDEKDRGDRDRERKSRKKDKKKDHKKKKHRPRSTSSSSSSTTTTSSRSPSRDRKLSKKTETLDDLFKKSQTSDMNWHLSQKSETLIYDHIKEPDDKSAETFVWKKKHEKIGLDKVDPDKISTLKKLKQEEARRELEKLEKRKKEREREREERDREREFQQRQKESEYHKEWEKQEDSFQLKQVKLRSKIRIEEGRAKPIDLLAKYINNEDDGLAIEMHEPYTYLNGLTIRDLEDLLVDIKVYSNLENGINSEYWHDIAIVTEDELKKLQKLDKYSLEHAGDRREGINQSVLQDVSAMFKGKTLDQLLKLKEMIELKLKQQEVGVDLNYWHSLQSHLIAHMAKARLKEQHQKILKQKAEALKREQGISCSSKVTATQSTISSQVVNIPVKKYKNENEINIDDSDEDDDFDRLEKIDEFDEAQETDEITQSIQDYNLGSYSPVYLRQEDLPGDVYVISQVEDDKRLEIRRNQVLKGSDKPSIEDEFERKLHESMNYEPSADDLENKEEESKSEAAEVSVQQKYSWSDKYRPRKPRYYNRVHTGYDWNQYNKKHYDMDNPPPKTVQGYKFNIFYPDLIDKTKTPKYSITVCQDNKDFAILRFHAGPPYEDVAFKIVNREWDISYRHGFRNQFQNGIYQLWFHFRKWKYRR
ncbi:unnamed protein product [Brachionus calyciflorus]|uniref:Splicing factor Cactin n=1 Tax=Brachionus calyciflorus TaxID=104777 RepID=A0A814MZQ2_9BILA|nr:unnamed protein product [Brachionus calyciflorus]